MSNARTLQQMLLSGEPVSAAELREMTIRHILASPSDVTIASTIADLLNAYMKTYHLEHPDIVLKTVDHDGAVDLLKRYYLEAGGDHSHPVWPAALPMWLKAYPRDILVEIGTALGTKAEEIEEGN